MSENLTYELSCRADHVSKPKPTVTTRRHVYALEDAVPADEDDEQVQAELAAIRSAHAKLTCWNCDEQGHIWENCLADRRIFCYGCGQLNVYKPQCKTCLQRLSENRRTGATNNSRLPPKS
ncbi:hypothetical protein ACLKA7_001936 [Drosophila subpalustris]